MSFRQLLRALFTPVPRVRPRDREDRIRRGDSVLIDVREPHEWNAGVAEKAVLLPLSDLRHARVHWTPFLSRHRERELVLYCKAGGRSAIAAKLLAADGFRAVNGGSLRAWQQSGWPILVPPNSGPSP